MNINLISPTDNTILNSSGKQNGHRYTIRFKEDILIPAKSKIHLNFATLSRQSELSFFDDQLLNINIPLQLPYVDVNGAYLFNNILPRRKLDATNTGEGSQNFVGDPTNNTAGMTFEVKIPKGFYTFERFYKTLTDGINTALKVQSDGTTPTITNNVNYRASEVFDANPLQISSNTVINTPDLSEGAVISMGILENTEFVTNNALDFENVNLFEFAINASHKKDAATTIPSSVGTLAFVKSTANLLDSTATAGQTGAKVYDSYAMGVHNYRHTGIDDNTPLASVNIFKVITNQTYDQIATDFAAVAFGLGSQEVANGIQQTTPGAYPADDQFRTQGSAVQGNIYPIQQSFYRLDTATGNVKDTGDGATRKVPTAFITCVITAENDANGNGGGSPKLEIYTGRRETGTTPNSRLVQVGGNNFNLGNFRSINEHFFGGAGGTAAYKYYFLRTRRIDLGTKGFAGDEPIALGIQLYQKPNGNGQHAKTYFRVLNLTEPNYALPISQQKDIILYDSFGNANNNFNTDFFYYNGGADIDYKIGATAAIRNNKVASQTGFTPMLWSNTQYHGFSQCSYRGIPRGTVDGVDYSASPMTLFNKYYLSATQELAEMFNIANDLTTSKVTNTDPLSLIECNTGMVQDKTTYGEVSRGWRARSYSIFLRGLPLQNYKNKSSQAQAGFSKQILANVPLPFKDSLNHYNIKTTGIYEPNSPIVSHLYNQDMVINKFEVDIKQMSNDRDATEIEESIINFTIVPPDDYDGNINAVAGFKKLP